MKSNAPRPAKREEGNPMVKKRRTRTIHRRADTGQFCTKKYAEEHANTTVKETLPIRRRRRKKK